jgi:hypothetical protein
MAYLIGWHAESGGKVYLTYVWRARIARAEKGRRTNKGYARATETSG